MIALDYRETSGEEMKELADGLLDTMGGRRSVRNFDARAIPDGILEDCVRIAARAPSGANLQPWHFCIVRDGDVRRQIRLAAEEEERRFYNDRAPQRWLDDLAHLGTDDDKPFLEEAGALVVVFSQPHRADGRPNYYVKESVGIAVGFLLMALHQVGLCALTHTPSPMAFLSDILERPANERAYMVIPVGYPTTDCQVPDISRKPETEVISFR